MKRTIDAFLARALAHWVDGVRSHARTVVVSICVVTLGLALYTGLALGINSDNVSLVPTDLPSRKAHEEFIQRFPNLEEAIFVVIDAGTPELAREAAHALTIRLNQEPATITDAYEPASGEFFERNGLLYRSVDDLENFSDQMARIQPLVSQLEDDASIGNMVRLLQEGLDQQEDTQNPETDDWIAVLDRMGEATIAAWNEYPVAISWEELLLRGSALDISSRRVIVVHPVLDYQDILLGRKPMATIRQAAVDLDLTPERGVQLRLTGTPALNYDEMIGIAWDVGMAGLFCFAMVALVLHRALRSARMVVAVLCTLVVGLIWTAAFTAASIGTLNPVSITFAILFIGLGVDFGLHLGTGYIDLRRRGESHNDALRAASAHVGSALVLCTVTTSIGFYVFVPTGYRGVAELGLIAGTGMFIILFLTLTFFPALLSSFLRIGSELEAIPPVRFRMHVWQRISRHPAAVRWSATGLGLLALTVVSSGIRFNANAVDMRDPDTESVQAFNDLLADSSTSPWYLNVLTPNLETAVGLGDRLEALEEVSHVLTLQDFVPENQEEKLAILDDVAFLFEVPASGKSPEQEPTPQQQIQALRSLHAYLETAMGAGEEAPLKRAMSRLRSHLDAFLARVETDANPEIGLAQLQAVLLDPFPEHLRRLRNSMQAEEIELGNLPGRVTESFRTEDGTARIQVYPASSLADGRSLRRFVEAVQSASPNAAGVPLNLVEFGDLIRRSFFQALTSALVIIAALLWLLWRSLTDMLMVIAPLTLGVLLTAATARVLDIPLDFTNVVAIPLLFGIGVDSAIHLVQRHKDESHSGVNILETPTARAIFYSALTTIVSFGSLAFAGQRGLASLGLMLSFGLFYTVVAVLGVLPAVLDLRKPDHEPTSDAGTAASNQIRPPR